MISNGSGVIYTNGVSKIVGFIDTITEDKVIFEYGFNVHNNSKVDKSVTLVIDEDTSIQAIEEDIEMYELLINKFTEHKFGSKQVEEINSDNVLNVIIKERAVFEELFQQIKPYKYLLLSQSILKLLEVNEGTFEEEERARINLINSTLLLTLHIDECGYDLPTTSFGEIGCSRNVDVNLMISNFLCCLYGNDYIETRNDIVNMYSLLKSISEVYGVDIVTEVVEFVKNLINKKK